MLKIDVRGIKYDLCNDWHDITLAKFRELISIEMPVKLKRKWQALLKGDNTLYDELAKEIHYRDIVKTFPEYYGKVLKFCSTVPQDIIEQISWQIREQLFNEYLLKFAISGIADLPLDKDEKGLCDYNPKLIESFEFEGERFFLPKSLERGGAVTPLVDESILTFSEASDIEIALHEWAEKGIDAMSQVIAVYCLKEGEKHTDELVLERTEKFKTLPMSEVWEVFFYIVSLGLQSQIATGIFSKVMETVKSKQQLQSQE
jgi:hypothetical protein